MKTLNNQPLKLLLLEPFFGGSHRDFAENLVRHSRHNINLISLPAVNWKWRLRGAAFHFASVVGDLSLYDGIIATSTMRLSDFRTLVKGEMPPVLVYFHENQMTYPLASGEKRNPDLCIGEITTALSADRVLFNSHFHMSEFLKSASGFLSQARDILHEPVVDEIELKSGYLYPGTTINESDRNSDRRTSESDRPLVLWNHRWSYDKNAPSFFYAVDRMIELGKEFDLAIVGENSGMIPQLFLEAESKYKDRLIRFGYIQEKDEYLKLLNQSTIIVSTAVQENFGISVIEAIRSGCLPLLPDRLSYPEILPDEFHKNHLYRNQKEFLEKFSWLLDNHQSLSQERADLSMRMDGFSWETLINRYDVEFERLCSE